MIRIERELLSPVLEEFSDSYDLPTSQCVETVRGNLGRSIQYDNYQGRALEASWFHRQLAYFSYI